MVRRNHERIHENESNVSESIDSLPEEAPAKPKTKLKTPDVETPASSVINEPQKVKRYSSKKLEELGAYDQAITVIDNPSSLVVSLSDPEQIIPHSKVPDDIKKAIIETYGSEFFHSIEWSAARLKRLATAIRSPRHNSNNIAAQVCGPVCSFKDTCPYDIVGRAPIGERCPIELNYAKTIYDEYVRSLAERLNIDEQAIKDNIILNNHINSLVVNEMVDRRMDGLIARDGVSDDIPVFMDEESGQVFYRKDESTAIKIKARLAKNTDSILRQLLATPEMAERYRKKTSVDALSRTSEILDNIEKKIAMMIEGTMTTAQIEHTPEPLPDETK